MSNLRNHAQAELERQDLFGDGEVEVEVYDPGIQGWLEALPILDLISEPQEPVLLTIDTSGLVKA